MGRFELEPCRWRSPAPWDGRQLCRSPIVNPGPFGVMDHQCWMCTERDHLDQVAPAEHLEPAGFVRHLIYHVYPVNDRWQWHMRVLREHMSLFNGRRIVSVAVGPGTATWADVVRELDGLDVDVHEVRNDPDLKEVMSYPLLLELISRYTGPRDVHFYGHAKGVVTDSLGPGTRRWTEAMYEALLDYWPVCAKALIHHAAVGIFRRLWEGPLRSRAKWHFSGAFRWVRNRDLFSRDWRRVEHNWLGVETHPGIHFGRGESACLYGEFDTQDVGLYAESEWQRWAQPLRDAWVQANAASRQAPVLATVILTSHRQPELVHDAIRSVQRQTSDSWQLLVVDSGPMVSAGIFDRYKDDARVQVLTTGETADSPRGVGRQAWAINGAWRQRRVRGDLVLHLSDDDMFAPEWLERCIEISRERPEWSAWYGSCQRQLLGPGGRVQNLGVLRTVGPGERGNSLRCRVDGMQVCHRAAVRVDWPEDERIKEHADGYWMDRLAERTTIWPVEELVGFHRHTPLSAFTRSPT